MALTTRRIAITGGPGAGKTTLWRELAKAHAAQIVAVPEVATLLFRHVFPPVANASERAAAQRAIFFLQRELEAVHDGRLETDQRLLCDRGTVDGAAYWPAGHEAFFAEFATTWARELARYDAVLFLETAAAGGMAIAGGNNPVRREDVATAVAIDRRLRDVWSPHPQFVYVPHSLVFPDKIAQGRAAFAELLTRAL